MKISDIRFYRFSLSLKRQLQLKDRAINARDGFIVGLTDDSGNTAYGEASPLPGFSREDPTQVENTMPVVRSKLTNDEIPPDVERCDGGFERWLGSLGLSASMKFAVESAVLGLVARSKGVSVARLLGAGDVSSVTVNALLTDPDSEIGVRIEQAIKQGFTSFKLKIGGMPVKDALARVAVVREKLGNDVALRLDANRSFVLGDAIELMRELEPFGIEYVEEPAQNLNQLRKLIAENGVSTPVALDESLLEIGPDDLSPRHRVGAVVIKPMLLGLERACRFAVKAKETGAKPVVSSSFESSVGMSMLASLAAIAGEGVAAGLDTMRWFDEDLVSKPISIEHGKIELRRSDPSKTTIDSERLEEVVLE